MAGQRFDVKHVFTLEWFECNFYFGRKPSQWLTNASNVSVVLSLFSSPAFYYARSTHSNLIGPIPPLSYESSCFLYQLKDIKVPGAEFVLKTFPDEVPTVPMILGQVDKNKGNFQERTVLTVVITNAE